MTYQLLAVPGASRTSSEFRRAFAEMVDRHGWDGDAIAAVISRESGFKAAAMNPQPGQTATGLIQFTIATLRGLGFPGSREQFAALDELEQLPFVERYFERAFPRSTPARSVDYYLATWGARAGLPLEHVLAAAPDKLYEINKGLDVNGDGAIRVADLDAALASTIGKARGERLPVGKVQSAAASSGSSPLASPAVFLPRLQRGNHGPAVELFRALLVLCVPALAQRLDVAHPDVFDVDLDIATRGFQAAQGLDVDGVVGERQTWPTLVRLVRRRG